MKSLVCIIAMFLTFNAIATFNSPVVNEKDSSMDMEIHINLGEPEFIENEGEMLIHFDGCSQIISPEKPIIPSYKKTFIFPVGTRVSVQVKPVEIKNAGNLNLKSSYIPAPPGYETKISSYKEDISYPERWYHFKTMGGIKNGKHVVIAQLILYPVKYDKGEVLYASEFSIKMNIDTTHAPLFTADEYDLLIVCPNKYKYGRAWYNELLPLVEHKEGHGIRTKLVSLDQAISGTYFPVQGRDDAEKLKYFIKEAIEQWGIKYVMLVGGRQGGVLNERWLMPVRYTHLDDGSGWEASYLSDLYFADVYKYEDGKLVFEDWDSNGNGKFAEWKGMKKDELDLAPDVAIGRLACRNIMEVKIMVKKIIEYENSNALNEPWFKKMVVVGGDTFPPEDDPYYEGEVSTAKSLEYMEGFEPVKLWTSLGTLTGEEDVVNAVSQGCGFLNFEGHGNPMSWATHPPNDEETWIGGLIVSDIPKLSNKNMYPVCVVGGCHNSQFNVSVFNLLKLEKFYETYYKSEWSPECWSWWLARKIDGGSIATIGCTGLGYGYIGDYNNDGIPDCIQGLGGWIDIEFFRIYGQEKIDVLGDIHSTAITNYVSNFPVMKDNIDCKTVQEWVLLGDPSLKIGGYS